ncbi:MAG: hypothetical protein WCT08_04780 [Patescibacteria group bacterium]|jgi:hypothetical protein
MDLENESSNLHESHTTADQPSEKKVESTEEQYMREQQEYNIKLAEFLGDGKEITARLREVDAGGLRDFIKEFYIKTYGLKAAYLEEQESKLQELENSEKRNDWVERDIQEARARLDDTCAAEVSDIFDRLIKINASPEVIDALADALAKNTTYAEALGFNHSICHEFECYPPEDYIGRASFLNSPEYRPVSEKIINICVDRAIRDNNPSCLERIYGPLIQYNADNIPFDKLEDDFPFKPKIKNQEGLLKFFPGGNIIFLFLQAEKPKDFFARLIEQKIKLKEINYKWKPVDHINILRAIAPHVEESALSTYLKEYYNVDSLTDLTENYQAAETADETEVLPGYFVDIEGTLLLRNGSLNKKLLDLINSKADHGEQVTLFSGGSVENLSEKLRELGVPEKFLPVVSKLDYKGKTLEHVIDDTLPVYQGFRAIHNR